MVAQRHPAQHQLDPWASDAETAGRARRRQRRIAQLAQAVRARQAVGDHAGAALAAAWLAEERAA